jgi:predicted TIM-barrel fold metal-dependent hydrolase
LVARHPERFAALVTLPLPHIDASLREMARGLDELGMAGVHLSWSVFDRSLAEAEFEPLYAEMDRRRAVLFFHPVVNGICSAMINDYRLAGAVGTSLEDTVIGLHLISRQIPTRYPNIRIIIPHFGGNLPMLLERLDNQLAPVYPELTERPSVTARRFYYDTVGHGSQAALLCAWRAFGAGHLVPGSDYPVLLPIEGYARTFAYIRESGLPPDDIEQILHRTAPALFGFAT